MPGSDPSHDLFLAVVEVPMADGPMRGTVVDIDGKHGTVEFCDDEGRTVLIDHFWLDSLEKWRV